MKFISAVLGIGFALCTQHSVASDLIRSGQPASADIRLSRFTNPFAPGGTAACLRTCSTLYDKEARAADSAYDSANDLCDTLYPWTSGPLAPLYESCLDDANDTWERSRDNAERRLLQCQSACRLFQ